MYACTYIGYPLGTFHSNVSRGEYTTCFFFLWFLVSSAWQVDVSGTGLEHLVNGAMGKALSVYATNDADKVLVTLDLGSTWGLSQNRPSPFHLMV